MKLLTAFLFTFICYVAPAQYYYSDIIGNQLSNQQYKLVKENRLKKINATSYEGNAVNTDFELEQTISNNGLQIVTRSASAGSRESFLVSTYDNNKLVKTVDSSANAINVVLYQYNDQGRLGRTTSVNKDFDGTFSSSEEHQWVYNTKGVPQSMLKIKNSTDTTAIVFNYDEKNNIAEEIWKKKNRVTETYYYYYNNPKNLLTDIVRYSRKAKQMLPDYIFDYDSDGRLTQMTQSQLNNANYLVWKYIYNAKGLKEKELVYNKQKELLGRIEYIYQ